ncbi:hypothetical protein GEMRC1_011925 [Eukaryota sp. GEM-RC1]
MAVDMSRDDVTVDITDPFPEISTSSMFTNPKFNILARYFKLFQPEHHLVWLQVFSSFLTASGLTEPNNSICQSKMIVHESQLISKAEEIATSSLRELNSYRKLSSKPKNTLMLSSIKWLLLSHKYQALVELASKEGLWELAFMVAPLAGYNVWKELVQKRRKDLQSDLSDELMGVGLDLIEGRGDKGQSGFLESLVIAKTSSDKLPENASHFPVSAISSSSLSPSYQLIETVYRHACSLISTSNTILASACWLSVSLIEEAILYLLNSGETYTAFSLAASFDISHVISDSVVFRFCLCCFKHKRFNLGLEIANKYLKSRLKYAELVLLASRFTDTSACFVSYDDHPYEPICNLIKSSNHSQALASLLKSLEVMVLHRDQFRKSKAQNLLFLTSCIDPSECDAQLLGTMYCFSYYLSGILLYFKEGYFPSFASTFGVQSRKSLSNYYFNQSQRMASHFSVTVPKFEPFINNLSYSCHFGGSHLPRKSFSSLSFRDFFHLFSVCMLNPVMVDFDPVECDSFDPNRFALENLYIPF